jgi:hypothetical protein
MQPLDPLAPHPAAAPANGADASISSPWYSRASQCAPVDPPPPSSSSSAPASVGQPKWARATSATRGERTAVTGRP